MAAPSSSSFGSLLRHHRLAAGLTQEALAERSSLSPRAIIALERGERRSPYPNTVQLLADALQLSTEERAAFRAVARAGSRVADQPDMVSVKQSRRLARLAATLLCSPPGRIVAVAFVLVLAASAGLIGQHQADISRSVRADRVASGSFAPWGLARTSLPGSALHLAYPFRTAVDRQGNIYVTEGNLIYYGSVQKNLAAIVKLSPSGRLLARWGRYGLRPGQFEQPAGVAVD